MLHVKLMFSDRLCQNSTLYLTVSKHCLYCKILFQNCYIVSIAKNNKGTNINKITLVDNFSLLCFVKIKLQLIAIHWKVVCKIIRNIHLVKVH